MQYRRSLLVTLAVLCACTAVRAEDTTYGADAPLRSVGVDIFGWADKVELAIRKLLSYADASSQAINKQDLANIALLLQEIAAKKQALAKRLESPELWQRGPSGERSYRGSEIEDIVSLLNQVNKLGRGLDPKWQTNNFELTGYMKAVLADKFVLIDKIHYVVEDGGQLRGATKSIALHVAVIENGLPSHRIKASELAGLFREEATKLTDLSKEVLAAAGYHK